MMSIPISELLDVYGYRWCPENVKTGNITTSNEWYKLSLKHKAVMAAVRQYQTNFKDDLDALTIRGVEWGGLKRAAHADGDLGVNTHELMGHARCGCPDYYHPDAAKHEGLQRTVFGANWPNECRNVITISWNFEKLRGLDQSQTYGIFTNSCHEWSTRIVMEMTIDKRMYPNTRIAVELANLSGSTLADQFLATSSCGFTSKGRMDIRDWTLDLARAVRIHEDGHAHGLHHVPDGVATMNPTITQACINRQGKLTDADIVEAKRIGYSERIEPEKDIWVTGELTAKQEDGDILGRFEVYQTSGMVIHDGKMWIDGIVTIENVGDPQKFVLVPDEEL